MLVPLNLVSLLLLFPPSIFPSLPPFLLLPFPSFCFPYLPSLLLPLPPSIFPPLPRLPLHLLLNKLGGPIWTDPIHDSEFVRGLLESVRASPELYHTAGRINGLLTVVSEVRLAPVPGGHTVRSTLPCADMIKDATLSAYPMALYSGQVICYPCYVHVHVIMCEEWT